MLTRRFLPVLSAREIRYLLRDDFTIALAAGGVDGTAATPGGGGGAALNTRNVVDTGGDELSIAAGQLILANPVGWGDPGLWYGAFTRAAGAVLAFRLSLDANNTVMTVGFDIDQSGPVANTQGRLYFTSAGLQAHKSNENHFPYVAATPYQCAIVLRAAGAFYFLRGGTEEQFVLLWLDPTGDTATLYPSISDLSVTGVFDTMRIPQKTWLPAPLAYDSFTRADGAMGSTETTGPDSQAVTARAWTAQSGVWAISGDKAVATTAGIATLPALNTADMVIDAKITTPGSGTTPGGLVVRYTDADNYWYVKLTPGTAGDDLQLIERDAGAETVRASADVDWAASTAYDLRVICAGDAYWKVYAGTDGSPNTERLSYTSANPFNRSAQIVGLRDEGEGNLQFDDVAVWARGTGGEYAALAPFFE